CDDYVLKPFSPRELIARIKAVLRRTSAADESGMIEAGDLVMNTVSRKVMAGEVEIRLGPTEYRLLEFFMSNQGRAYSRSQILDHVWGTNVYLEERTVDVHIRRLRKALEHSNLSDYVQTVRGHGYRFLPEA
ncbi:MAG: DNA-binding response regulator, partial [Xanthomonadales bacterium]|nr:DNA-binding response regulator [Xanthomonadales bacterium]